ncbi:MAG: hypothetical protein ACXAEU_21870 [Candidatus Hodarchaeales archaeon]|jgi:hypothetical protein
MTLRKDYENDAWEALEDYFDKIYVNLLKANIKGEERQRVIAELRGHVQLKADEILACKDIVSFSDVLDIMSELGSPVEIAESCDQVGKENLVTPRDELLTESKSLKTSGITDYPAHVHLATVSKSRGLNDVLEISLLAWRFIQVIFFILPWFFLRYNFVIYETNYDLGGWSYEWFYYYFTTYFSEYFVFLFLFVVLEHYIIRNYIFPRMRRPSIHQSISIVVFRFALLSNIALLVLTYVNVAVGLIITVGVGILLVNEAFTDSALRRHVMLKTRDAISIYSNIGKIKGLFFLFNLILSSLVVYIGLTALLAYSFFFVAKSPVITLIMISLGTLFTFSVLLLNMKLNRWISQEVAIPVEINSIVWAFRLFLAVSFVITFNYPNFSDNNTFTGLFWLILPLILLENIFTKIIMRLTDVNFSLSVEIKKTFDGLNKILLPLSSSMKQHYEEKVVKRHVTDLDITIEPVENYKEILEDVGQKAIPTTSNVVSTSIHKKSWKESTLVAFIWDITIIYCKAVYLFLFLLLVGQLPYSYGYYFDPTGFILYTISALFLSSYKLYSLSKNLKFMDIAYPYYYWSVTIVSWIMIIFFLPMIILAFPFIAVQITSSIKIYNHVKNSDINYATVLDNDIDQDLIIEKKPVAKRK